MNWKPDPPPFAKLTIDEMDKLIEEEFGETHQVFTTMNRHRPLVAFVWFPCHWKRIGWESCGVLLCAASWRAWAIQVSVWRFTVLFVQGGK